MRTARYGMLEDGTEILRCELEAPGIRVRVLTYGGIIEALEVPDGSGRFANVALGLPSLEEYVRVSPYFGAIVGRFANRIAHGSFTLDGETYQLARNDGANALHGGPGGFSHRNWTVEPANDPSRLELRRVSPSGEEGYPGTLDMCVTYTVGEGRLTIEYGAMTDAPTILNVSNHSYWNLSGEGSGTILAHELTIPASWFTPVGATQIPTGALRSVETTPFDFRKPVVIGARIGADDPQLFIGGGYDHNWVLDPPADRQDLHLAARVRDPVSGRRLTVWTDQPGLQFYSGNLLDGTLTGLSGRRYGPHHGLALETQHFPDSPNQPAFPSTALRPGQRFRSVTAFAFDVASMQ